MQKFFTFDKPFNQKTHTMKKLFPLTILSIILLSFGCQSGTDETEGSQEFDYEYLVQAENFDTTLNGKQVKLYTLQNDEMLVKMTNFGAVIVQILVPDKEGNIDDVTLGYPDIEGYINDQMSLGCTVGRYANRIDEGQFTLNGKTYQLPINNGPNSLHGGPEGFHSVVWDAEQKDNSIVFNYTSPHMEMGYPGELQVTVTYSLTDDNEILIDYEATTNDSTYVNLTNHAYFNLLGEAVAPILDHKIQILADYITPVDSTLIPTGEFMPVEDTPFDFRKPHKIGKRIDANHQQIKYGNGYDHNFVLARKDREKAIKAVELYEEQTGRVLEVFTSEPGIQFYSGNFMRGNVKGKSGNLLKFRHGLALEAQHFPDSPNQENFPSTLLVPGEVYRQITIYKFSTKE